MKVYFKMSKKKFANSKIIDLTPNKLYEVRPCEETNVAGFYRISDDVGYNRMVAYSLPNPLELCNLAKWIKHRPKKSNTP